MLMYVPRYFNSLVDVYCFDERYVIWSKLLVVGPITGGVHKLSIGFF